MTPTEDVAKPSTRHPTRWATRAQLASEWIIPAAGLIGVGVFMVSDLDRLPTSLAVHWGLDGRPNGSMPLPVLALLLAGIYLYIWIGVLILHRPIPVTGLRRRGPLAPLSRSVTAFASLGLLIGTAVAIVLVNIVAAHPERMHALNLVPLLVGCLIGGVAGFLVGRMLPPDPPPPPHTRRPPIDEPSMQTVLANMTSRD